MSIEPWKLFCVTEGLWKGALKGTAPTVCPDDSAHEISATSVAPDTLPHETVSIEQFDHEDHIKISGHFRFMTSSYDALAATEDPDNLGTYLPTTTTHDFSYPYNISVLTLGRVTDQGEFGNTHSMYVVAPQTPIGALTAPVAAGDITWNVTATAAAAAASMLAAGGGFVHLNDGTNSDAAPNVSGADTDANTITVTRPALHAFTAGTVVRVPEDAIGLTLAPVSAGDFTIAVSPTVIANAFVGMHIHLRDGIHTDHLTDVLSIDADAKTITCMTAATHAFATYTPIHYEICPVWHAEIGHAWNNDPGATNIGSTKVKAGSTVRPVYTNKKSTPFRIITVVQAYY